MRDFLRLCRSCRRRLVPCPKEGYYWCRHCEKIEPRVLVESFVLNRAGRVTSIVRHEAD